MLTRFYCENVGAEVCVVLLPAARALRNTAVLRVSVSQSAACVCLCLSVSVSDWTGHDGSGCGAPARTVGRVPGPVRSTYSQHQPGRGPRGAVGASH